MLVKTKFAKISAIRYQVSEDVAEIRAEITKMDTRYGEYRETIFYYSSTNVNRELKIFPRMGMRMPSIIVKLGEYVIVNHSLKTISVITEDEFNTLYEPL